MADDASSNALSSAAALLQPLRRPARPGAVTAILGRASGRRGPSALVRETAAMQLERRRADWAYSRPLVALDIGWNLAFAAATAALLVTTMEERPAVPLRVWIVGYAIQCLVHVFLVWTEFRRRSRGGSAYAEIEEGSSRSGVAAAVDSAGEGGAEVRDSEEGTDGNRMLQISSLKRCESFNTIVSFIWWIVGFYWILSGSNMLVDSAPRLYWLTVIFLAVDALFALFCLATACLIGIALCCCLPCVIALLYALSGEEGAPDADISVLPRYRYYEPSDGDQKPTDEGIMIPILNNSGSSTSERILLHEDAECCICLLPYEDGAELGALPCNHHFHSPCIVKWLRMHATCPLCKYNILKGVDNAV